MMRKGVGGPTNAADQWREVLQYTQIQTFAFALKRGKQ